MGLDGTGVLGAGVGVTVRGVGVALLAVEVGVGVGECVDQGILRAPATGATVALGKELLVEGDDTVFLLCPSEAPRGSPVLCTCSSGTSRSRRSMPLVTVAVGVSGSDSSGD